MKSEKNFSSVIPDKSHILMSDVLLGNVDVDNVLSEKIVQSAYVDSIFNFTLCSLDEDEQEVQTEVIVAGLLISCLSDKSQINKSEIESKVQVSDAVVFLSQLDKSRRAFMQYEFHVGDDIIRYGKQTVLACRISDINTNNQTCILSLQMSKESSI
jgi:hypothetical protein